jgi:hypothetical protein
VAFAKAHFSKPDRFDRAQMRKNEER